MKIVILDGYTLNPGDLSWEGFEKIGNVTVYDRTPVSDENEIVNRIGDAEIVITNKTPITASTLAKCPAIRYIGVLATGYNVIDVEAAKEKGIPVCNIPAYGTDAVGQFAIALLLEICNHVGHHGKTVSDGRWTKSEDFCYWDHPLIELSGKTMGIIGFGRIGQATGKIAKAMNMNVLAYDTEKSDAGAEIATYVTQDEIFAQSDVISLHCPLFPATEGIINKDSIAKMKDKVIIINNSRGPLIVEQDLADALNSGKVYAAGLDVVSVEPIKGDNPLLNANNCIITPHISWAPIECRDRLMGIAVDNLQSFLAGNVKNRVN